MHDELIGLIPSAGKGIRLGLPYPKELYPVIRDNRYKPVAQYVLDNLTDAGLTHVVFVVNETKHQLIGYFGSGQRFGCHISYVVQEATNGHDGALSTSPGLAHALDAAYHLTRGKSVCFGMADTIMQPQNVFARVLAGADYADDLILACFATEHPEKFGMVLVHDGGRVEKIVDKPDHTELTYMWGCMVWRPRFTEFLHEAVCNGESDFAAIINCAIADGFCVRGVTIEGGTYIDLGTYDEIMALDRHLRAD